MIPSISRICRGLPHNIKTKILHSAVYIFPNFINTTFFSIPFIDKQKNRHRSKSTYGEWNCCSTRNRSLILRSYRNEHENHKKVCSLINSFDDNWTNPMSLYADSHSPHVFKYCVCGQCRLTVTLKKTAYVQHQLKMEANC